MLTIDGLIAVISLCLTAFGLGYSIGSNNRVGSPYSISQANSSKLASHCSYALQIKLCASTILLAGLLLQKNNRHFCTRAVIFLK